MKREKHLKLCRKLLGALRRPQSSVIGTILRIGKSFYLIVSWAVELVGDLVFWKTRDSSDQVVDPKRVLIIKIDQLGDVLFSTLLIPAIMSKYPNVQIDYLVRPASSPVLDHNPNIHSIYHWNNIWLELLPGRGNRKKLRSRYKQNCAAWQQLRANHYDYVINARAYPPSSNLLFANLGQKLVAFDISEFSFLADYWAPYSLDDDEVSNYRNLLAPLGITSVAFTREFFNYSAKNRMDLRIPYVVLSPLSFENDRQWKVDHWWHVIRHITAAGFAVALTGLSSHRGLLQDLVPVDLAEHRAIRVFTDLTFAEFGSLMKGAASFVGIDSFPAHLAIALDRCSAILVNPGSYFVKGLSERSFAVEARSMLPEAPCATLFDLRSAQPEEIVVALHLDTPTRTEQKLRSIPK